MSDTAASFGTYALNAWHKTLLSCAQSLPVNWFGRRGALALRKMVLASGCRIVDADVENLKLRLYMNDNVSERKFLFMPQFFDNAERAYIKDHIKDGDVFVDIGANAGIYTMTAAACVGETGRVLAVEPNPAVLERLQFNAELNGFSPRILIEQSGVSDQVGSFDLTLDHSNLGGSSLVAARSDSALTVQCYTLIDILNRHQITKISGLKIDIEGAEDKALIPFFDAAPESLYPNFVIIENSEGQWNGDLIGTLKNAGYTAFKITRMNTIWVQGS